MAAATHRAAANATATATATAATASTGDAATTENAAPKGKGKGIVGISLRHPTVSDEHTSAPANEHLFLSSMVEEMPWWHGPDPDLEEDISEVSSENDQKSTHRHPSVNRDRNTRKAFDALATAQEIRWIRVLRESHTYTYKFCSRAKAFGCSF